MRRGKGRFTGRGRGRGWSHVVDALKNEIGDDDAAVLHQATTEMHDYDGDLSVFCGGQDLCDVQRCDKHATSCSTCEGRYCCGHQLSHNCTMEGRGLWSGGASCSASSSSPSAALVRSIVRYANVSLETMVFIVVMHSSVFVNVETIKIRPVMPVHVSATLHHRHR